MQQLTVCCSAAAQARLYPTTLPNQPWPGARNTKVHVFIRSIFKPITCLTLRTVTLELPVPKPKSLQQPLQPQPNPPCHQPYYERERTQRKMHEILHPSRPSFYPMHSGIKTSKSQLMGKFLADTYISLTSKGQVFFEILG